MGTYEIRKRPNPLMFNQLRWLGLARADKDDYRETLKCVSIREKEAVCTDGKRLHKVAHNLGQKPGLYAFEKFSKSVIVLSDDTGGYTFPDVDALFKENAERANNAIGIILPKDHDSAFAILARIALVDDHTINFYYLENAMSAETIFTVYHGTSTQALYFVGGDYFALIMPKRIKENVANGRPESPASGRSESVSAKT